jgi:hypothetical protein
MVPEHIVDYEFEHMMFTYKMLEVYYMIDGRKSVEEIRLKLHMNMADIIIYIRKMTLNGIIRVRKKDKSHRKNNPKTKREYIYRGAVGYV